MDFANHFIVPSTRQREIIVCLAIMAFPKDKQFLINQTLKNLIVKLNDPSPMVYALCRLSASIVESICNY